MLLPMLGDRHVDAITAADVADLVGALTAKGKRRETVRKACSPSGWSSTMKASRRTSAASPGHGSASTSASATWPSLRTRTATFSADEAELDYAELLELR
jgi:hypothetical protein